MECKCADVCLFSVNELRASCKSLNVCISLYLIPWYALSMNLVVIPFTRALVVVESSFCYTHEKIMRDARLNPFHLIVELILKLARLTLMTFYFLYILINGNGVNDLNHSTCFQPYLELCSSYLTYHLTV